MDVPDYVYKEPDYYADFTVNLPKSLPNEIYRGVLREVGRTINCSFFVFKMRVLSGDKNLKIYNIGSARLAVLRQHLATSSMPHCGTIDAIDKGDRMTIPDADLVGSWTFEGLVYDFGALTNSIYTWGEAKAPEREHKHKRSLPHAIHSVAVAKTTDDPDRRIWRLQHPELGVIGTITLRKMSPYQCTLTIERPKKPLLPSQAVAQYGSWEAYEAVWLRRARLFHAIGMDLQIWIGDDLPRRRSDPTP
jgi:hypothetical protein